MPFTTPVTAAMAALERLGARRIAVLTPYGDEVNEAIHRFLTAGGLDLCPLARRRLRARRGGSG